MSLVGKTILNGFDPVLNFFYDYDAIREIGVVFANMIFYGGRNIFFGSRNHDSG